MPDFGIALKDRLEADAPLIGLLGAGKLHWVKVPQGKTLPYLRLQVVSDPRGQHLAGYDGSRQARVQMDCFASSWGQSREIAQAAIDALANPATQTGIRFGRIKAEGPRDLGEDTSSGYVFRASIDLLVEFSNA